jgi:hypothetical protein
MAYGVRTRRAFSTARALARRADLSDDRCDPGDYAVKASRLVARSW